MTDAPPRSDEGVCGVGSSGYETVRSGFCNTSDHGASPGGAGSGNGLAGRRSSNIITTIAGASSGDTITLAPGTYSWWYIIINGKSLTFRAQDGHWPEDTIIDGNSASRRIFEVTDGSSLTIERLTLRNGRAANGAAGVSSGASGVAGENGGAISFAGPVTITSSTITGYSAGPAAAAETAATASFGGDGGAGGSGGAVYATNTVTITSSTITAALQSRRQR